jgi:hypothetical protein
MKDKIVLIGNNRHLKFDDFERELNYTHKKHYQVIGGISLIPQIIFFFYYFFLDYPYLYVWLDVTLLNIGLLILLLGLEKIIFRKEQRYNKIKKPGFINTNLKETENFLIEINRKSHICISKELNSIQYVDIYTKTVSPLINFKDITSAELLERDRIISKVSPSLGSAIAGGLLFGGTGAIAGSLAGKQYKSEQKTEYSIRVSTKLLDFAGFQVLFRDPNDAIRLMKTLELIVMEKE